MSLYDAYAAADSSLGWKAEAAARLREFVERKLAPAGRGVESALRSAERAVERAVENGLSLRHVRTAVKALSAWMAARLAAGQDVEDEELENLCERILHHTRTTGFETHSRYLFTLDMKF